MAAGYLMKRSFEKRIKEKQLKIDDIIVFDENLPKNCSCTFVDFAPTVKFVGSGEFKSVSYSELIDFANKWLQMTEFWDVINCETFSATVVSKQIHNLLPNEFGVRIFRLWIRLLENTTNDKPNIPQIQYKDFEPNRLKDNEFESIDVVVERINQSIKNGDIHGKILSVQTLACSAQEDWTIDKDTTQAPVIWMGNIVYILRIFYILGENQEDEIGLTDFVPECLSGGNLFNKPKFESQSDVLMRVSKWLSENPEIKFCSSNSIDVKLKSSTKLMSITRKTGHYLRIIRIAYTKPQDVPMDRPRSSITPPPPPIYLKSQLFVLHKSHGDLKKEIADFMDKENWTAQHQYKWILLNWETLFVMSQVHKSSNDLKSLLESNSDQSFQVISSSDLSINQNLFFAVKLYYDVGVNGLELKRKSGNKS